MVDILETDGDYYVPSPDKGYTIGSEPDARSILEVTTQRHRQSGTAKSPSPSSVLMTLRQFFVAPSLRGNIASSFC